MIWSLEISSTQQDDIGLLCAGLFEFGCIGVEETGLGMVAFFEESTAPSSVSHLLDGLNYAIKDEVRIVSPQDANDYDPILIGSRFVLVPASRIVLPIDAAMAFGSGRHESTQLCLEALAANLLPGQTVYDVGCGSGILALAAAKLGAGRVIACDVDEPSIAVALRHFTGPLFVGSADGFPDQSADVTLCNITGPVLDRLAADLQRITKLTGFVIISGFTSQTVPSSFTPLDKLEKEAWQCWICKPDNVLPAHSEHTSQAAAWWL